jgi:hypothetical protein
MEGFEDVAKELSSVDDRGLSRVSKLAYNQLRLEKRVADLDVDLKQAKRELREISDDQLPAAMLEYNIREFTLEDGSQIKVKHFYSASIPKDKMAEAFDWLNANGYGDLIKNQVSVSFVRGQEEKAQGLVQELEDRNLPTSNKKWVEPMTLKAFARELVEAGKSLPFDLFGLFIGETAKITKPKG